MAHADDIATQWHKKVEGRWFGSPSHYDAEARHIGFSEPKRRILRGANEAGLSHAPPDPERVFIDVPADLFLEGPLKSKLEVEVQSAWVRQTPTSRIYEGPDFFGAGYPYGSLTLGWVYFAPWKCDAKVIVQILPDHVTQVYDNVQYIGERQVSSLNGLYLLASDFDADVGTQARVRAFLDDEIRGGKSLFRTSMRHKGAWSGTLEAYDAAQERIGDVKVQIDYEPLDHHRHRLTTTLSGALEHCWQATRYRHDHELFYEGPDVYGNAIAYGRSLYVRTQTSSRGLRVVGREFMLDRNYSLAVVWELMHGHHLRNVLHGVLRWTGNAEGVDNR